jgi:hypothetical protein
MTPSMHPPADSAQEIPSMMATLNSYQGFFGPYHAQTLAMTTVLAEALCASGNRVLGKRLLERAIGDLTKYHGRHHPARIRALEAWSSLLRQDEDWKAALPVQQELLDCRNHALGPDHPQTLAARDNLSWTLSALMSNSLSVSA